MKNKITSSLIVNICIGSFLALVFITWGSLLLGPKMGATSTSDSGGENIIWRDNSKPIDAFIPDTIPYRQYKMLTDSVNTIRKLKNGDAFDASSSSSFGVFATYSSIHCDTCSLTWYRQYLFSHTLRYPVVQSYIQLSGWKLKQPEIHSDSVRFYVDRGQSYLRKLVIDSIHNRKNGSVTKIAHYQDFPVSFRYSLKNDCLLIPVSQSTKKVVTIAISIIGLLTSLYYLFFVLGGFAKFLIDVSRGQTFTEKNVKRLKVIAISLIALPGAMFLLNLAMPLIFRHYFTADITLNLKSWNGWYQTLLVGIVFLLLYKAFRSGRRIKEEQDLVI